MSEPENTRWLPPCERAQADGVPCPELGRDCEICEQAYERRREEQAAAEKADGA